jgi:arylsulfatase A-like enzyme
VLEDGGQEAVQSSLHVRGTRYFWSFVMRLYLLSLLCLLNIDTLSHAADSKPNVIVILTDDQGWGDLSLHGNTNLKTPRIDSLAKDGAQFEHFYVCALCAPTRAEFLTGRYHPRTGVRGVSTGQERLNLDEVTIADTFRAAGYRTAAIGKWHNGSQWPYHPCARGFDEFYGFTSGHWGEYFDPPLERATREGKTEIVRGKGFIADVFTDEALRFIETNKAAPFFCYLAYNTPHSPFSVPDEDWNRHKDNHVTMRGAEGEKEDLQVTRSALALCENLDCNIGRVLDKLTELKLSEDTIVVYFHDNGPNSFRWNGGMKGKKGSVDEGGVRSPLFVRWPAQIKPGTTIGGIAGAIDLLPTLAKLAGLPLISPKTLDGLDYCAELLGKRSMPEKRQIFSYHNGRISLRTNTERLDERGNLYDLSKDPGQTRVANSDSAERVKTLAAAVAQWRADVTPAAKKDDRPYPVGYKEFPVTYLPARDGNSTGTVKRTGPAPNCSYFTNWTSKDDRITWDIEIDQAGEYELEAFYTVNTADVGATVEAKVGAKSITATVTPAWDPPLNEKDDRVPRKGESYQKEFRPLALGKIELPPGRTMLTLRATEIPGKNVMDLRMIRMTLAK